MKTSSCDLISPRVHLSSPIIISSSSFISSVLVFSHHHYIHNNKNQNKQTSSSSLYIKKMNHISQEWPRKRMMFLLESSLMKDRFVRDAWLNWTTESAMLCKTPLAKNMPHTRAFQRKVAVWRYNQHGMYDREMWQLPAVCSQTGQRGISGTRNFVPHLNVSAFTMSYWTNQGMIMAHRVKRRGYGTDPHLRRGQWEYRFYKSYERNNKHLTRA